MREYDAIVIGSGSGSIVADEAAAHGAKVALVEKSPLVGGTCLNLGCIPSKTLIYPADRVVEVQESARLGIQAEIKSIDFPGIMARMRKSRAESQEYVRKSLEGPEFDFHEGDARFVDKYTLEVKGETLKAKKVFIVSGSRPLIPPIEGLNDIRYLTNETALELTELPKSIVIIGGGYVACEYAHFFASMGSKVTVVEMLDRLLSNVEPEMSELLLKKMSERMTVILRAQIVSASAADGKYALSAKDTKTGETLKLAAEQVLVAVGRKSNADLLKVEKTGVEVDSRGYIKVNEFLETSQKNIFATGDAIGKHMFTHVANREASLVWHNSMPGHKAAMDYTAIPYAVFSHPQIAGVGMTSEEARKGHDVLVGIAHYSDVAKGDAMMERDGFAKAIIEKDSGKILGFHIIGPMAPELIQEVTNAMATGAHVDGIRAGLHIHPALNELIERALESIEEA